MLFRYNMINILTNRLVIILVFILIELSSSYRYLNFLNKKRFFIGSWKLRSSNDDNFNDYVYLKLNIDNTFKLRSVKSNGIFAIKTSKYGKINYNLIYNLLKLNFIRKRSYFDIEFKSINKYSYSIFGIEIPEIKFDSNEFYNINHKISVKYFEKSLYITNLETNKYYIFDMYDDKEKKPYVEMSLNNLLFTQIFSFIINYFFVKIIN